MYEIFIENDNEYLCKLTIQEDVEAWVDDTLKTAVENMKKAAWFYYHIKIKKKDIIIYRKIVKPTMSIEWKQIK